jgi:hypothetical protein
MDRRKLTYYLLLNVFVSACVTSAILYWYDRNYRSVTLPQAPAAQSPASATGAGTAVGIPEGIVQIVSVIGAGNLEAEAVVIRYTGPGELVLTGWHLKDSASHTFTFPPFKLFKDGAVRYTRSGTNTAIDLFWGSGGRLNQAAVCDYAGGGPGTAIRALIQAPAYASQEATHEPALSIQTKGLGRGHRTRHVVQPSERHGEDRAGHVSACGVRGTGKHAGQDPGKGCELPG